MCPAILQRPRQPILERDLRRPAKRLVDLAQVAVVITNIDGRAVGWKCNELVVPAAVQANKQSRQFLQADMLAVTQVEDPTFGRRCGGGEQQCLDYIVNEIEVATLAAIAEDLNRFAFNEVTNPNAQERLTPIFDAHAGTVGIGQAQRARPNLVSAVVKQVIPFAGQ